MEIWRSGPSGGNVTKSGWVANWSGSSLRFSDASFSRSASVSRLSGRDKSSRSISSGWPRRRAPKRRASVALPTPSGPEKSSVCERRSCSSIWSSAAVTAELPQKFSNMGAHNLPNVVLDRVDGGAAVDDFDALRLPLCEGVVGMVDALVELERLIVHAGFRMWFGDVAGTGAGERSFGIHVDQNREIRFEAAARDAVQRLDGFDAEIAAAALIDE